MAQIARIIADCTHSCDRAIESIHQEIIPRGRSFTDHPDEIRADDVGDLVVSSVEACDISFRLSQVLAVVEDQK